MKSSPVSQNQSALAQQYNDLRQDAFGGSFLLPHQQINPNMTLYIEQGVVYIGATRVIYAGGNTPTITAPVSNPRIDLVTIDSTGTIAIVTGTEGASPVTPAYPSGKLVICEIYNRVGETSIKTANDSVNGYIYNDVRSFVALPTLPPKFLYDAIVDASGNGDYTTLGAAISAGALRIFIKSGNYTISSNITIPANCILVGENWQDTIITLSLAQFVGSNSNIIIRDLQFAGSFGSYGFMFNLSGNNIRFEHCQILQASQTYITSALELTGNFVSITDCIIQSTDAWLVSAGSNVTISRNRFVNANRTGAGSYSCLVTNGNDVIFTDNFVIVTDTAGYSTSGGYGNGCVSFNGIRTVVSNNNIINNGLNGAYCIWLGGASDVRCIGNHIHGFVVGIYIYDPQYRVVVSGNTIEFTNGDGIQYNAYSNTGYGNFVITGNNIYSTGGAGIKGFFNNHVIISNNTIYGCPGSGIELDASYQGNYMTIIGNNINGCGADGIKSTNTYLSYSSIIGNSIHGCLNKSLNVSVYYSNVIGNAGYSSVSSTITNQGGSNIQYNIVN